MRVVNGFMEGSVKDTKTGRETEATRRGADSAGFALILALLALMLLTFLGITLTTSTSTELQVAANYRWSQQAYYNAEAGIEAAKVILRRVQDATQILPVARTTTWTEYTANPTAPGTTAISSRATRNFENWRCDNRGNGVGYGAVVDDNGVGSPYENVRTMFGSRMQGGFTIWVRRPLTQFRAPGTTVTQNVLLVTDYLGNDSVVITAEGVAPDPSSPNKAVRVLETTFQVRQPCDRTENELSSTGASPCLQ
jgi:Tfp pilus assembly protein PilX